MLRPISMLVIATAAAALSAPALAGVTYTGAPASLDWFLSGTTVLPYANDHSDGHAFGDYSARPLGVAAADISAHAAVAPYLRATASVGTSPCIDALCTDRKFLPSSLAYGVLSYGFTVTADSGASAAALIDYMASIAPLREDAYGTKWGLGGYDLEGATFAKVSRKEDFFTNVIGADVSILAAYYGTPFFDDAKLQYGCTNRVLDLRPCDSALRPFTLHTALAFDPGSLDFSGYIILSAATGGTASYLGGDMWSAEAIIDPTLHLAGGFTGDPSHYRLSLPGGIGNGPITKPPGVPEPGGWALMITGFALTGAAIRRSRSARIAA